MHHKDGIQNDISTLSPPRKITGPTGIPMSNASPFLRWQKRSSHSAGFSAGERENWTSIPFDLSLFDSRFITRPRLSVSNQHTRSIISNLCSSDRSDSSYLSICGILTKTAYIFPLQKRVVGIAGNPFPWSMVLKCEGSKNWLSWHGRWKRVGGSFFDVRNWTNRFFKETMAMFLEGWQIKG